MAQTKKIVVIGDAKGIIIPKTWLDYQAKKYGQPIREVVLTEQENGLLLVPISPHTTACGGTASER